jgi:hypothetical protein
MGVWAHVSAHTLIQASFRLPRRGRPGCVAVGCNPSVAHAISLYGMATTAELTVGRAASRWTVPGTVREHLAEARARGEPFPQAWSAATANLTRDDVAALSSTRSTWEAAYLGLPDGCSTSFDALASTRSA